MFFIPSVHLDATFMGCTKAEWQESGNRAGHRPRSHQTRVTALSFLSSQCLLVYNEDLANLEIFQVCPFELDTLSQMKREAPSLPAKVGKAIYYVAALNL